MALLEAAVSVQDLAIGEVRPEKIHVLLVDDERLSRVVVSNLLRKCNYDGGCAWLVLCPKILQGRGHSAAIWRQSADCWYATQSPSRPVEMRPWPPCGAVGRAHST